MPDIQSFLFSLLVLLVHFSQSHCDPNVVRIKAEKNKKTGPFLSRFFPLSSSNKY